MTAMTDLILETFRLNGALLAAGDKLVADLSLTSARWQVLGAVGMATDPLPVSQIARNMGLSRQAVQRMVNELAGQGIVGFQPNPQHQRAKLVVLTAKGHGVYAAAMQRQSPWAAILSQDIDAQAMTTAIGVLRTLRDRLDTETTPHPKET